MDLQQYLLMNQIMVDHTKIELDLDGSFVHVGGVSRSKQLNLAAGILILK